ncbi:MAG: tRNA (adenosine(37)-N6)-threonylcarbamoyltransferase complex dimerization subunit type 1 TsaB [Alphaproteobacteria bacterium]|nr:MAG: tRNA (adenosine(37)-N6)-threonylcarbamoyltransferase complex dimerization subunit type 1 TsaB [Alphaproteobacteria bacterium]
MITLAIDSTMNGCSTGLYHDEKGCMAESVMEMSRGQAEHLMPMIDAVLDDAGIAYNEIDLIAVTKGPGAFTGMRIGLATAKSLAMALEIPVIGVCTFRAVLQTYLRDKVTADHDSYGVLLETKRQDYYFQMFDGKTLEPCTDKVSVSTQDIVDLIQGRGCVILGDASQRFKSEVDTEDGLSFYDIKLPCPAMVADCAGLDNLETGCDPVYLRAPEIGTPKNPPRKMKS